MSQNQWLSKSSLLSDLSAITGVRCYHEITTVGDKPPAVIDSEAQEDDYYQSLHHDGNPNDDEPDLELIEEMLQIVNNYDEDEDVCTTSDESSAADILQLSKLNPVCTVSDKSSAADILNLSKPNPVCTATVENSAADILELSKPNPVCNASVESSAAGILHVSKLNPNVKEFKPKHILDYNSPHQIKDVNLNTISYNDKEHQKCKNELEFQKHYNGNAKVPKCNGKPEVQNGRNVNPELPISHILKPDIKNIDLKIVSYNEKIIEIRQDCDEEQKGHNVDPEVLMNRIVRPEVKHLKAVSHNDKKIGIHQDRNEEPQVQKGGNVNPEISMDCIIQPEVKYVKPELQEIPINHNITAPITKKHNFQPKIAQDCNIKSGVQKIKSIDQTIEENIQQFKTSTQNKISRNAAMASLLKLHPPTPKVTLLTPEYFTRSRASSEVEEPQVAEYNVVDFLTDAWNSVTKSKTVAVHTDANDVTPPKNKGQNLSTNLTCDNSSEFSHSTPVNAKTKFDSKQPVLGDNDMIVPPERLADKELDIKPDIAVEVKLTTTNIDNDQPCNETINKSIEKVGNWLTEAKQETLAPSLCIGPFKYKRKVKKTEPQPQQNSEPVIRSPPHKMYVPSQLAEDLYVEFQKRSEMNSNVKEDIWTKVERELKNKDKLIRSKKLEQEHSAMQQEIEEESEANGM